MRRKTSAHGVHDKLQERRTEPGAEPRIGMSWLEWSVLLALATALVLATLIAGRPSAAMTSLQTRSVRIRTSQTLWDIAKANPVPGNSTAQTVALIRDLNDMTTSTLYAEQILQVPAHTGTVAVAAR